MRSALVNEIGVLEKRTPEKSFLLCLHTEKYTKKCSQSQAKKKAYTKI